MVFKTFLDIFSLTDLLLISTTVAWIPHVKCLKIALRMGSGKLGSFQSSNSLHRCIVENREMCRFSCIDVTFCTSVI